jgi:A/G-specific adenine glycosylase
MRVKSGKISKRRPPKSSAVSSDLGPAHLSPEWLRNLRQSLHRWYRRNARDLPWRRTHDPYAIWISETMLQQTQVATVIPYYERFLASFPTIAALAVAPEASVLRHWEGLGYYRRARQLHKAAQVLVGEHGGQFPRKIEQILALPGIGRYTAGAIVSFAFDEPAPIVEANTLRVYCRLLAFRGHPRSGVGQRLLWETAEQWLPRRHAGEFNQALMELGSTVCKPREPACDCCPVLHLCPTRAQGLQDEIPAAAQPKNFESVREAAIVVRRKQTVLLVRRGEGERWAGLWDFPRFAVESTAAAKQKYELQEKLRESTGLDAAVGAKIITYKHGVTRFRITLDCFEAEQLDDSSRTRRRKHNGSAAEIRWVNLAELDDYALPVTGRKLAKLISR